MFELGKAESNQVVWMGTSTTSDAQATATVDRYVEEVLDSGDLSVLDDLVATDVTQHGPGANTRLFGAERLAEFVAELHEAFPNLSVTPTTLVTSDAVVVVLLTFTGTHAGRYMGVPPTGDTVIASGMSGFRVEDDQITETWTCLDRLGILQQLQAFSTPGLETEQREFPTQDLPFDWETVE